MLLNINFTIIPSLLDFDLPFFISSLRLLSLNFRKMTKEIIIFDLLLLLFVIGFGIFRLLTAYATFPYFCILFINLSIYGVDSFIIGMGDVLLAGLLLTYSLTFIGKDI